MKIFSWKLSYRKTIIMLLGIAMIIHLIYLVHYQSACITMNKENFTSILQDVHNNVFEYQGDTIKLSGYIYRAPDLQPNQFVIARNMMVSENEYRIVGFLCEQESGDSYPNHTWVKAKGTIILGDYHGPMPIIHIEKIKKTEEPSSRTVLPPPHYFSSNKSLNNPFSICGANKHLSTIKIIGPRIKPNTPYVL